MAGCRHRLRIRGRRLPHKHSCNANNKLKTESNQGQSYSDFLASDNQMEKFVAKKLEDLYKEAHAKLLSFGYDHDTALSAILMNGHVFGGDDVLDNIVQNSINYIDTRQVLDGATQNFADMRLMIDYSLTKMINWLRQGRPELTKRQALGCLFLSNFNLGVAGAKTLPLDSSEVAQGSSSSKNGSLHKDLKSLKRFNLTPSLACQLKRNVADYATVYRTSMKASIEPPVASQSNSQPTINGVKWDECCLIDDVFDDYSCQEDDLADSKTAIIFSLVDQIEEVGKEEKERKEWAQRKVIQAAEKISSVFIEINELIMERVHGHQTKDQKLASKEERIKKLNEMEKSLRDAKTEADRLDVFVVQLVGGNAKIRAEIEAHKLNASESDRLCLETRKKEKKHLKKIMALEKQNNKLQEETAEMKNTTLQLKQQITSLNKAQEDIEVRLRCQMQEKEVAISRVKEELRLKGKDEVNFRMKQEQMWQERGIECQRHKNIVRKLEQEISVQLSSESAELHNLLSSLMPKSEQGNSKEAGGRICWTCKEKEASVVVLPCTHQVLCAGCNKNHCRSAVCRCPYCHALISETIVIYGSSS